MIGLRFKANQTLNTDLDISNFYNYGVHTGMTNKSFLLSNTTASKDGLVGSLPLTNVDFYFITLTNQFLPGSFLTDRNLSGGFLQSFYSVIINYFSLVFSLQSIMNGLCLFLLESKFFSMNFSMNFSFLSKSYLSSWELSPVFYSRRIDDGLLTFMSSDSPRELPHINKFSENSSAQRLNRFNNLLINYDYKTGHYTGDWEKKTIPIYLLRLLKSPGVLESRLDFCLNSILIYLKIILINFILTLVQKKT
jgi:hypothetical protein